MIYTFVEEVTQCQMEATLYQRVCSSKMCESYFRTCKCLLMGSVTRPVNILNHMSAEAGDISLWQHSNNDTVHTAEIFND